MRPLLAAALLAATAVPVAAQPGVTSRVERLPEGVERVGYRVPEMDTTDARTDVTVRLGDVAVRRQIVYPAEGDTAGVPQRIFTLTRAGQPVGRWDDGYSGAWDRGFDLLRADLDADGTRELVVVQHESEGNGMGVATWSVRIVPETALPTTGGNRPLVFWTSDYGPTGLVVRRPGGRRVMAASWESGSEAGRGEGLYYTARFFRYDRGALLPDGPVLQRRFLFSFADLRGREAMAERYHPEQWIRRNVRVAPRDPWLPAGTRLSSGPVAVTGRTEDIENGTSLTLRHADGRVESLQVSIVGDAETGRFFPMEYVPLNQPDTWLVGRTGRLDVYRSVYDDTYTIPVLWLDR